MEPRAVCKQLTRIPNSNVRNPTGHVEPDEDELASDWRVVVVVGGFPWVFGQAARQIDQSDRAQTDNLRGLGPLSEDQQRI